MSGVMNIDKLKGRENFDTWKLAAQSYLVIKGLWANFKVVSPTTADEKEADLKTRSELILLIEPENYCYVSDKKTAKEAWESLISAFEDSGNGRKVFLLQQLVALKLSECGSTEDYVNKMSLLALKVRKAGLDIGDDIVASLMLGGLPTEYRPMVIGLENSGKKLTTDYVKNILLQSILLDDTTGTSENALVIKHKKKKQKKTKRVRCFECGEDHFRRNCPKLTDKKGAMDQSKCMLTSFLVNEDKGNWFIDSGASAHMTKDKTLLKNVRDPVKRSVVVANNHVIRIECMGDIEQEAADKSKILIRDVQYIPELCTNLLSVGQIVKYGNKVIFTKDGCEILSEDDDVLATGTMENNMFKLDVVVKRSEIACTAKTGDVELWHRRLGHASVAKMRLLLDINFESNKIDCKTCCQSKQTTKSFNTEGTRAEFLLKRIHSDVCGPLPLKSIGGALYFVTFIDDFSRMVFVYTIKSKGEVFTKFVEFKKYVENQLDRKIKMLRTDNGTEYINKTFDRFCVAHGIKHEKSAPYSAQQNGLAERMNRTIFEKVRAMLFDSKIGKVFWAEAVHAAVNIINALPNGVNKNKSPYEMWFERKPDVSVFKIFGCCVMSQVPGVKRGKLDERSVECIHLRYASDAKAYRLYNPLTRKTFNSCNVRFFEDGMMDSLSHADNSSKFFFEDVCDTTEIHVNDDNGMVRDDDSGENSIIYLDSSIESTSENTMLNETTSSDEFVDTHSEPNALNDTVAEPLDDTVADPTFTTRAKSPIGERPNTRSTSRTALPPNFLNGDFAFMINEPGTYEQAMRGENKQEWIDAMRDEYDALIKNNTWKLVERPQGVNVVDNRWIFKVKMNPDNTIERYKARLVARGFTQQYGIDYYETFSPVVRFTSIRSILAMVAQKNMHMMQFDVKTAFLNGELDENVYMEQPVGFNDNTRKVCKLKKSLYGLKQASRCWNNKFKHFIEIFGFVTCKSDPCVFVSNKNNQLIILAIHVDDGLIAGVNMKCVNSVIQHLGKHFEIKTMAVGCFLGLEIEKCKDGIFVHQAAYAQRVLEKFKMEGCVPVCVPSDPNQNLNGFGDSEQSAYPYRELVGSLMYLSIATRPDITYAVGIVSRYLEKPTIAHETAAKRILKYLRGTINFGIFYSNSDEIKLIGYSDADYAGDSDTRRSTSGYFFEFGNGPISWCSERQKCVSLSTTEAEYIAASNAVKELVWLRRFINEILPMGVNSVIFLMDNQSAIRLVRNPEFHKRSKHIDVRYHFIREKYEEKQFKLEYISTNEMIADIFTKPLAKDRFVYFRSKMGIVSLTEKKGHNVIKKNFVMF